MPLTFCLSGDADCCNAPSVNAAMSQSETVDNQLAFTTDGTAPFNLTGYTIQMQIGFPAPLLLNTTNGGITITSPPTDGLATINIADSISSEFPVGSYPYDLFTISGGGQSIRWFGGSFTVNQSETPL